MVGNRRKRFQQYLHGRKKYVTKFSPAAGFPGETNRRLITGGRRVPFPSWRGHSANCWPQLTDWNLIGCANTPFELPNEVRKQSYFCWIMHKKFIYHCEIFWIFQRTRENVETPGSVKEKQTKSRRTQQEIFYQRLAEILRLGFRWWRMIIRLDPCESWNN